MNMDIKETRRENLRKWLETHKTPPAERSYFSQLLLGTSTMGERAARRIEAEYNMGAGYLDTPLEKVGADREAKAGPEPERMDLVWVTPREMQILTAFRASSERGKASMEVSAEVSEKERSPLRSVGGNQAQ
jgi:hypothetical protein